MDRHPEDPRRRTLYTDDRNGHLREVIGGMLGLLLVGLVAMLFVIVFVSGLVVLAKLFLGF